MQGWHGELAVVHLVEDQACGEVEPKPGGAQSGLGDEEGRVLVVVGPVEGVVDQGVGHTLAEGGLEAGVPMEAGQTDQERLQGEEACRHDLEDHRVEVGDPGREEEDLEDRGVQVDQEEDEGGPASLLKEKTNEKSKANDTLC